MIVKLIAETTHQVQKALNIKAWTKVKYIEKAKPKATIPLTQSKSTEPWLERYVKTRMAVYIAKPAKELGIPKVLLCLLYWTLRHHALGKNKQATSVPLILW